MFFSHMRINSSDRFYAPQRPAWFSRPFYPPGYSYPSHAHTFAEVFWVVRGRVRHQVGDSEEILTAGDVRFIHPATSHALTAGDASANLANLAFPDTLLRQLEPLARPLPFTAGSAPGARLDGAGRSGLDLWCDRLSNQHISLLDVGSFLLWLLAEIRRPAEHAGDDGPPWLTQALNGLNTPELLAGGAHDLVQRSGRSAACVGRHIRQRFGCTTIQLINRRRLAWLAHQLRTTGIPIPELAESCGLANLSNCYRQFRAAYGCPPGAYRAQDVDA
jgi:AraC family transcriptional regulator, dual regulator of chb operon